MDTFFAPAVRTERRIFERQIDNISHSPLMDTLLKSVGGLLVVLNEDRQITAINHAFLDALGVKDPKTLLGLRLGESLHCIHADKEPHGCGTTAYCRSCGAAIAMMDAINDDKTNEQICALTTEKDGVIQDTSLLVRAQPLVVDDNRWILIFSQDITQQQFWITLERVFFHDINNILAVAMGHSELLAMKMPDRNEVSQIRLAVERLYNEISLQRVLSLQKNGHYLIRKREISIHDIQKEIDLILCEHPAKKNRHIKALWPDEETKIFTDAILTTRVLGNMLVNGLEATPEGEGIHFTTIAEPSHIIWEVWNTGYIPDHIQKRIFQKHFSTKEQMGRGFGTYSMKLFGEHYLGGEVSFTSSQEKGTTFTFRLPRSP